MLRFARLEPEVVQSRKPGQTEVRQDAAAIRCRGVGKSEVVGRVLSGNGMDALPQKRGIRSQEMSVFRLNPRIAPPLGLLAPWGIDKRIH